jgi:hypothetical protein
MGFKFQRVFRCEWCNTTVIDSRIFEDGKDVRFINGSQHSCQENHIGACKQIGVILKGKDDQAEESIEPVSPL